MKINFQTVFCGFRLLNRAILLRKTNPIPQRKEAFAYAKDMVIIMNLKIGENIRKHRRDFGLSQETLAERLGVSFQAVSKWERNET